MDPETKKLLRDTFEISKENNKLLHKLVRSHKMALISRVVYWAIIIFVTVGAYYYIQPFFDNLINTYGVSDQGNVGDIFKNLNNQQQIQDLFDSIKK